MNSRKILKNIVLSKIVCLFLVLVLTSCAANQKISRPMTRAYVEYCRGKSSPTTSDIAMAYGNSDYRFHQVYLKDESFFPDHSIIPNAFLTPLFDSKFKAALDAFTEPYYGCRVLYFLKKHPRFGIGAQFIHQKVFLLDRDQRVRMAGTYKGEPVDEEVRIGDYLDLFNISHGINHAGILFNYRWMLYRTPQIPDGRLQPFVSFSIGPAVPHLELNLKEQDIVEKKAYSYQSGWRNWGGDFGFGIRYKRNRHLGFYLEYKLSYSYLHGMYFDNEPGTRVLMDFFVHHLQWGISIML